MPPAYLQCSQSGKAGTRVMEEHSRETSHMNHFDYRRTPGGRPALQGRGKAALAGALLLTGSIVGWTAAGTGLGSAAAAPVHSEAAAERTIGAGGDSYAGVVDQVAPAVVTIRSERRVKAVSQ